MGGGFLFSLADWKHSSGRGTAVGWLVCLWRLLVLLFWVFSSPPPPLRQALHFVPGLQELAAGAQGCQGGRQTRAGRCGLRDATGRGRGRGRHCCRGLALSMSLAGGKQRSGRGDDTRDPPPPLPAPAAGPEGRENVQVRGLFRCPRERWKKRCSRDLSALRGAAVSRGGMLGHGVCAGSSPPPHCPQFHAPAPHLGGLACAAAGGHVVVSLGLGGSPAELALQVSGVTSYPG